MVVSNAQIIQKSIYLREIRWKCIFDPISEYIAYRVRNFASFSRKISNHVCYPEKFWMHLTITILALIFAFPLLYSNIITISPSLLWLKTFHVYFSFIYLHKINSQLGVLFHLCLQNLSLYNIFTHGWKRKLFFHFLR